MSTYQVLCKSPPIASSEVVFEKDMAELDTKTPLWDEELRIEGEMRMLRQRLTSSYADAVAIFGKLTILRPLETRMPIGFAGFCGPTA